MQVQFKPEFVQIPPKRQGLSQHLSISFKQRRKGNITRSGSKIGKIMILTIMMMMNTRRMMMTMMLKMMMISMIMMMMMVIITITFMNF